MTFFRMLVAAALLLATTGTTTVFAKTSHKQHRYEQMLPRFRGSGSARPWCLHDYVNNEVDCSYSSRSQCAATASGGLGECSMN